MNGRDRTFFQCLATLRLLLGSLWLLEDVGGEMFVHLKIVRCSLNTQLMIDAGIAIDGVPAGCVQWVSADFFHPNT